MSTATTQIAGPRLEETFTQYTLHWNLPAQTDTPDLISAFQRAEERMLIARGAAAQADEDADLAEADMAAGLETLDH